MKNKVVTSTYFNSKLSRLIKKKPNVLSLLFSAIFLLHDNHRASSLKIHKLSGELKNCWSFSLTHDLRVIFRHEKSSIVLIDIGSHDEVY